MAFCSPGPTSCVTGTIHCVINSTGDPPVWFRLTSFGDLSFHTGHADAGFAAVGLEALAPLAIASLMLGLPVMTKLPQMRRKARAISSPRLGVVGPK